MGNYNLKPVWTAILDIYKAVADICARHNLRHFAAYGTLLGAIRHNGFIPWDDDFDIHMPRPDYQKLIKIANNELSEGYLLVSSDNCDGYRLSFAKVYCVNRSLSDEIEEKSGLSCSQGLFIDIFPVDGVPDSFLGMIRGRYHALIAASLYRFLFRKECGRLVGKISFMIGWLVHVCYRNIQTFSQFNNWYYRFAPSFDESTKCGRLHEVSGWYTWTLPTKSVVHTRAIMFEGMKLPVPVAYDRYLRQCYGDYMRLPPESQRFPNHAGNIVAPWRFGDRVDLHRENTR